MSKQLNDVVARLALICFLQSAKNSSFLLEELDMARLADLDGDELLCFVEGMCENDSAERAFSEVLDAAVSYFPDLELVFTRTQQVQQVER